MDDELFKRLVSVMLPPEFSRMSRQDFMRRFPPDSIQIAEKTGIVKRIDDILHKYARCDPAISDAHAWLIIFARDLAEPMYEQWDAAKQAANLDRVERGLDDALRAIRDLPPNVSVRLISGSEHQQLFEFAQRLKSKIGSARRIARTGEPVGQTNWQGLSVARVARDLWEVRTGRRAPSAVDAAAPAPFGQFLQELYDELGISLSARSGLRSLKRVSDQLG